MSMETLQTSSRFLMAILIALSPVCVSAAEPAKTVAELSPSVAQHQTLALGALRGLSSMDLEATSAVSLEDRVAPALAYLSAISTIDMASDGLKSENDPVVLELRDEVQKALNSGVSNPRMLALFDDVRVQDFLNKGQNEAVERAYGVALNKLDAERQSVKKSDKEFARRIVLLRRELAKQFNDAIEAWRSPLFSHTPNGPSEQLTELVAGGVQIPRGPIEVHAAVDDVYEAGGTERHQLGHLSYHLSELNLPPLKEIRINEKITRPAVTWYAFSSAEGMIPRMLEGGRQRPGDALLVLRRSWLIRQPRPDGKVEILVAKAISFDGNGQAYFVTYTHPRRTGYYTDFGDAQPGEYTPNGMSPGAPALIRNFAGPAGSSAELEADTADKFVQTAVLAANGVAVPATYGFLHPDHPLLEGKFSLDPAENVDFARQENNPEFIERVLTDFMAQHGQMVIKPSGSYAHSGVGIKFVKGPYQIRAAARHILKNAKELHYDHRSGVLIQERIVGAPAYLRWGDRRYRVSEMDQIDGPFIYKKGPNPKEDYLGLRALEILSAKTLVALRAARDPTLRFIKKDVNLRGYGALTPSGGAEMLGTMVGRLGFWGQKTSTMPGEVGTPTIRLEDLVTAWRTQNRLFLNLLDLPEYLEEAATAIRRGTVAVVNSQRSRVQRALDGPYQAQSDMLGFDLMNKLIFRHGRRILMPVVIEVNDLNSSLQVAGLLWYPHDPGQHTRGWWQNMFHRADEWFKAGSP